MKYPDFKILETGSQFEDLCIDLLSAEGFIIEREASVDIFGFDIIALQEFKSHSGEKLTIRWFVQCKHYAKSGNSLGREVVEKYISTYNTIKKPNEGLLFIVDTNYTEPAKIRIDEFLELHKGAHVKIWNQRHLSTMLDRHPNLLSKYNLELSKINYVDHFSSLSSFSEKKILIISDQSNIAHNLTSIFRQNNFQLTFLPYWNYINPHRQYLFHAYQEYDLIICFLSDTFSDPLPDKLCELISNYHKKGSSVLFFPFFAWSINKGINLTLENIIPVKLRSYGDIKSPISQPSNPEQSNDFSFYLMFDSFAEDIFVEINQVNNDYGILSDLIQPISIKYSYEYLSAKSDCKIILQDNNDNPVIVVSHNKSKVAYVNICTHNCFSTIPISSPIETNVDMTNIFVDLLTWLLL